MSDDAAQALAAADDNAVEGLFRESAYLIGMGFPGALVVILAACMMLGMLGHGIPFAKVLPGLLFIGIGVGSCWACWLRPVWAAPLALGMRGPGGIPKLTEPELFRRLFGRGRIRHKALAGECRRRQLGRR